MPFLSEVILEERHPQGPRYYEMLITIGGELSHIYTQMRTGERPVGGDGGAGYAGYQNTAMLREITRELEPFLVSAAYYWLRTQGMDLPGSRPDWWYALQIDWYYPGGWDMFLYEHRAMVLSRAFV